MLFRVRGLDDYILWFSNGLGAVGLAISLSYLNQFTLSIILLKYFESLIIQVTS